MNSSTSDAAPRVTVFMPVYNRKDFLSDSLGSVLGQTFRDFELLVIDDGSTDGSAEVIDSLDDPRVRLVRNERNLGIPKTRNRGLELARGEYMALLDSDDWAYPRRLDRQVAFLDAHPEIAAVGTWARRVTRDGRRRSSIHRPYEPRDIAGQILFTSCFKNPTMMARTAVLREFGYREEFVYCQDIDLWGRVSRKYALANLPEFLIRYRLGGDSHQSDELSTRLKIRAAEDQLRDFGITAGADDLRRHITLRNMVHFRPDTDFIDWAEAWLLRLIRHNAANPCYPEPEFTRAAAERWFLLGYATRSPKLFLGRFLGVPELRRALPGVIASSSKLFLLHAFKSMPLLSD